MWVLSGDHQWNEQIADTVFMLQETWALAVNANVDSLWMHTYPGVIVRSSIGLLNGDVLITRIAGSAPTPMLNAMRLDDEGNVVWSQDIGPGNYIQSACEGTAGELYFGTCLETSPLELQGFIYATTDAGQPLWQRSLGNTARDEWIQAIAASFDAIIATGFSSTSEALGDFERLYVAGFDPSGTPLWEHLAGSDSVAFGVHITHDQGGEFIILGKGHPNVNGNIDWFSFVKRINVDGAIQ